MTAKTTATETARPCTCGCGLGITTKALYKPGHDAKHVSVLVAELLNTIQDGGKVTKQTIAAQAKRLPSEALRAKYQRAAARMLAAVKTEAEAKGEEAR